jgi:hypothetical protein
MSRACLAVVLLFASNLAAQQTATTSTQGAAILQKALAALAPTTPITDVTLSGTARRIAGSVDESGTVVVKALAGTGTRIDLTLSSGPRTEIRNTSSLPIAGSWSGPDGVSHSMSYHNLLTDPGWAPAFTIASLLSAQNAVVTYVGPETRDGRSVIHVAASQTSPFPNPRGAASFEHLSQVDFLLDSTTLLPAAISFNIHPDGNANVDIPIEIEFSNYTTVNGTQIPFHVQKFINNSLVLDLQFTSATLNSGLSASSFSL